MPRSRRASGPVSAEPPHNTRNEALALFAKHKPAIEKEHGKILYERVIVGDLNGDGRMDAIVEFGCNPGGGNVALLRQAALYLRGARDMRVVGGFEPDYCFAIKTIEDGVAIVDELKSCADPGGTVVKSRRMRLRQGALVVVGD